MSELETASSEAEGGQGRRSVEARNLAEFFPATREDFDEKAGPVKKLEHSDFLDEHRLKHLEAFKRTRDEWLNFEDAICDEVEVDDTMDSVVKDLLAMEPAMNEVSFETAIHKCRSKYKGVKLSKASLVRSLAGLVERKEIAPQPELEAFLTKRAVRTDSGVAVITVLTSPGAFSCPKNCFYCPDEPGQPRSYLSTEPAVLRANQCEWDGARQFWDRAITLRQNGHWVDKIEILVLGGTWSGYPRGYQDSFMRDLFYAANTFNEYFKAYCETRKLLRSSTQGSTCSDAAPPIRPMREHPATLRERLTLAEEQKINETAQVHVIGVTLETRPDYINIGEIRRMRELGCTRVQLGIQHTDEEILKAINRGCPTKTCRRAIRLLKDAGYKVDIHLMPDLPTSNVSKDLAMFNTVLTDPGLQADQWKIYPCEVTPFSVIEQWYKKGEYIPYCEENPDSLLEVILKVKSLIHPWIRLNRVVRDIPNPSIIAGNKVTNLRQVLGQALEVLGLRCQCMRCREIKRTQVAFSETGLVIRQYRTLGGDEYFLSYETIEGNQLVAFLRLRLKDETDGPGRYIFPFLKNTALVRELHVYGSLVGTSQTKRESDKRAQHSSFGSKLLLAAELLSMSKGFSKIAVISGIGVRMFYAKFGYTEQDTYMVKQLTPLMLHPLDVNQLAADAQGEFGDISGFKVVRYDLSQYPNVEDASIDMDALIKAREEPKETRAGRKKKKKKNVSSAVPVAEGLRPVTSVSFIPLNEVLRLTNKTEHAASDIVETSTAESCPSSQEICLDNNGEDIPTEGAFYRAYSWLTETLSKPAVLVASGVVLGGVVLGMFAARPRPQ